MSDEDDDVEEDLNEEPIDAFNEDIWGKTPQTDTLTEMAKVGIHGWFLVLDNIKTL